MLELGMARVEGLENRENSMGDGGPGELVEGWAKAVGSRTGIIMHLLEGSMNFSWIKRPIKEIKGASWTRVEREHSNQSARLVRAQYQGDQRRS